MDTNFSVERLLGYSLSYIQSPLAEFDYDNHSFKLTNYSVLTFQKNADPIELQFAILDYRGRNSEYEKHEMKFAYATKRQLEMLSFSNGVNIPLIPSPIVKIEFWQTTFAETDVVVFFLENSKKLYFLLVDKTPLDWIFYKTSAYFFVSKKQPKSFFKDYFKANFEERNFVLLKRFC